MSRAFVHPTVSRVFTSLAPRNAGLPRLWRQSFAAQSVAGVHLDISRLLNSAMFKRSFSMPVLECSCGMVMSTASRDSRQRCIRCGSIALRELNGGTAVLPVLWRFMNWPAMEVAFQPTSRNQNGWTTEAIEEGSHI
jgi:hypothetical protein